MSSLISIQKARPKRTVLPKTPIIQLFLENQPSSTNNSLVKPTSNNLTSKTSRILPKFNNQDVLKQLSLCHQTEQNGSHKICDTRENNNNNNNNQSIEQVKTQKINATQMKKITKENKMNEMARLCLSNASTTLLGAAFTPSNNPTLHKHHQPQPQSNLHLNQNTNLNLLENLIKSLAKEFLLDCKQRLESNRFKRLLNYLNDFKQMSETNGRNDAALWSDMSFFSLEENLKLTNNVYEIIGNDEILMNKFSMFLTNEISLNYGLFTQSSHYEKCIEFLRKIEMFMPNKHAFKKLVQSIISCTNSESDNKITNKIDEIKAKIKSLTKNNCLINIELDYLFDQRNTNLQPVYEKISLVKNANANSDDLNVTNSNFNEEFIDLTDGIKNSSANNNNNNNKKKRKQILEKNQTSKTKCAKKILKTSKKIKSNTSNSLKNE